MALEHPKHPFDIFCAAFGLRRQETMTFYLQRPDLKSYIRVSLFSSFHMHESLTLKYFISEHHARNARPADDDLGVWAVPDGFYSRKLLIKAIRPGEPVDDWMAVSKLTSREFPWARDIYAQVGGKGRENVPPFALKDLVPEPA